MLLEAGADPNTASAEGETVLMTAARSGSADLVRLLIESGAEVNANETWRGQTALMWAIAEKHLPVVRILLENGADINAKTGKGFTPFLFAVRGGDFTSCARSWWPERTSMRRAVRRVRRRWPSRS